MREKQDLLNAAIASLEKSLAALHNAAKEAKDYATDKDSKAESKYDTRGLEASYLAGAQAEKAESLGEAIELLRHFQFPDTPVKAAQGTITVVSDTEGGEDTYFILPAGGGIELEWQGLPVTVITHQSPRAQSLIGLQPGDSLKDTNEYISEVW